MAAPNIVNPELPRDIGSFSVISVVLSPSIVATITAAEQTFTVTGLKAAKAATANAMATPGDQVIVTKPTAQAGLALTGARVSADDTLALTFTNPTVAGITPTASETYTILLFRQNYILTTVDG